LPSGAVGAPDGGVAPPSGAPPEPSGRSGSVTPFWARQLAYAAMSLSDGSSA